MTQHEQTPIRREQLIETWELVSLEARSSACEVRYIYGEEPVGMLIYGPQSTMSVVLMRPDRPRLADDDPLSGTPEEIKAAFEGFDDYCGRYSLDEAQGTVTHHIQAGRFPN